MRLRSLPLALLALLSVPGAAARGGMPDPLTPRGDLIESIYFQIFVAGTIVFLIVMFLMIFVMVRFRAHGGKGRATYELERDNLKLEMTWIGIPLIVVLWVGVVSYAGLIELDEGVDAQDAWMELDITGFQWTWRAGYGSGISLFSDPDSMGEVAPDNVFVVPADVPIRFNVTAGDVIHALHIMDANWATVGLVDANPYGPHKYTSLTAELPEGEYQVQCREMCFNPGHGYMRAVIKAVPMEEFESWMEEQRLGAGAEIPQRVSLTWTGAGFEDTDLTFVTGEGSRAIVTIENTGDEAVSVGVPGMELLTSRFTREGNEIEVVLDTRQNVSVEAGQIGRFAFDLQETGGFAFQADGQELPFDVVEAEVVEVELGDFFISPARLQFEAGTTYLLQVTNVGGAPHNIFLDQEHTTDAGEVPWRSATIQPGATTSVRVTPDQAMELTTWCNVAGHYESGMVGSAVVE